jgi:hypothetical protein
MEENIITRLFASFSDLEQAIEGAKKTLAQRESVPEKVMTRLKSYDGILARQRTLAVSLCEHINKNNWDEVTRHVNLINGLSSMIRDDARAILSSFTPAGEPKVAEDDEGVNYC